MTTQTTNASPWSRPGWLDEATAWIDEQLTCCGRERIGAVEQPHVRPWSCVLRAPTTTGDVFFKAPAPAQAHETALTVALARWRPDCMTELLAADPARGWMLMPDGGTRLRALLTATSPPASAGPTTRPNWRRFGMPIWNPGRGTHRERTYWRPPISPARSE